MAEGAGISLVELSLRWLLASSPFEAVLVGASGLGQLEVSNAAAIYLLAVGYLAQQMCHQTKRESDTSAAPNLRVALPLAAPISLLAGVLGVGPGFLLMPVLILVGFEPKNAGWNRHGSRSPQEPTGPSPNKDTHTPIPMSCNRCVRKSPDLGSATATRWAVLCVPGGCGSGLLPSTGPRTRGDVHREVHRGLCVPRR